MAVLLGQAVGDEPPFDALARALRYSQTSDFIEGLRSSLAGKPARANDWNDRYRQATNELLEDLGLDPSEPDVVDFIMAAEPLVRAAPASRARTAALEQFALLSAG
jgi:hypothetical protein